VKERLTLETERRQQVESIEWRKLTGSGYDDLIIESDSGGGTEDRFGSDLHIFDLTLGRFEDLLEVPSRRHARALPTFGRRHSTPRARPRATARPSAL
jgi:hypothetical protein